MPHVMYFRLYGYVIGPICNVILLYVGCLILPLRLNYTTLAERVIIIYHELLHFIYPSLNTRYHLRVYYHTPLSSYEFNAITYVYLIVLQHMTY